MATVSKWTPFGVALDITATASTVTRTSATKYTVKINVSWETYYDGAQTNYGMTASSGGSSATINKFGTKASSGSGSFTGTYSISDNGSATKTVTVTFKNFNNDNGDSATKNVSFSVTVPAWTSYTVKYNANGGSGVPSSQTKWKDQNLVLSNTIPTKSGYSFIGWATSSTGSVVYEAGDTYTANASVTLYAKWESHAYVISYNPNGGSSAPDPTTKYHDINVSISNTPAYRYGYKFLGWGLSSSTKTVSYSPGDAYTDNKSITLYAIWEIEYVLPDIYNFSIHRCDSAGNILTDSTVDSTSALVEFSWRTYFEIETILIEWESGDGDLTGTHTMDNVGDTYGQVSVIIGDEALPMEQAFTIRATVSDSDGTSVKESTLEGYGFTIDLLHGGKGVAFGKPADIDDTVDFAFKARHRKNITFDITTGIDYIRPNGKYRRMLDTDNNEGLWIGAGSFSNFDFDNEPGHTVLAGYNVFMGVRDTGEYGLFRPYYNSYESITITVKTAGYVTNSGKDVTFFVPLSMPIVGSTTAAISSVNGFVLRQGNSYTHGSSASTYVTPNSYSATLVSFERSYDSTIHSSTIAPIALGVTITAVFSNTTNVTNNDAIGIYWNGTITFS